MKKGLIILMVFLMGTSLFAEINSAKFYVGVTDFANTPSDTWKIYDAKFSEMDPLNDYYEFKGGFVVKSIGFTRYDFKCEIKKNGDDFAIKLSDVLFYTCDKTGSKMSTSKIMQSSERVASQYASLMKEEIIKRMNNISDDEAKKKFISYLGNNKNHYYLGDNGGDFQSFLEKNNLLSDDLLNNTYVLHNIAMSSAAGDFAAFLYDYNLIENETIVNNPSIIADVAKNSSNEMQFERYLTKTGLIGKTVSFPVEFTEITKNTFGIGDKTTYLVTAIGDSCTIWLATNNEDYIDYKPNKKIEVSGTINSIKLDKMSNLTIVMIE